MTAKQYLSQAYRLNERINSDLSELDRLRDPGYQPEQCELRRYPGLQYQEYRSAL